MRVRHSSLLLAISACLSSLSVPALAQKGHKPASEAHDGDQFYLIDAEQLNADVGSPYGDTLKSRPPPKRALLIRPRASFVQEMLKSVENI